MFLAIVNIFCILVNSSNFEINEKFLYTLGMKFIYWENFIKQWRERGSPNEYKPPGDNLNTGMGCDLFLS